MSGVWVKEILQNGASTVEVVGVITRISSRKTVGCMMATRRPALQLLGVVGQQQIGLIAQLIIP